MSASDRLDADRIRVALGPARIGRDIRVVAETSSTNDEIAVLANAAHSEGVVVFAEHQTAGRGQRGNRWESTRYKGLWFSILVRPNLPVRESGMLTSWVAQVVAGTIRDYCGVETQVKPPNDVYIADRKVAGVLVEMKAESGAPHFAIVGVGINVNQSRSDFSEELKNRATSLLIATGRQQDRTNLAVALLGHLDRTYATLTQEHGPRASPFAT